ncbi:MAG TPA: ERCC4 domain-containing protein, partial [Rectinemataceae bacterium]
MHGDIWIVQSTGNPQFPYRIAISRGTKTLFAVRAKGKWPGSGTNIFCIRDGSAPEDVDIFEEVERVPVVGMDVFGKRISVTLGRPNRKRCEFLILEKARKSGVGAYEQIFFRTQAAIQGHRSRSKISLRGAAELEIAIDSRERYAWKFPGAETVRKTLPVGDYALMRGETIVALVERKTFDNLLGDFGSIVVLHQTLRELSGYDSAAVVIEARYGDFL